MPLDYAQPDYGLPTNPAGDTNMFNKDYWQTMFPYYQMGPQMAQYLANLQFGANQDAQTQNNALAMQLGQGAASNRFADNIASRLAIQGMGNVPGSFSALGQGGFGVQKVNTGNIMDIYKQMAGGLQGGFGAMGGQQTAQGFNTTPIPGGGYGGGQQPGFGTPGNPNNLTAVDALHALRAGNQPLATYILRVSSGLEAYDPVKAGSLGYAPPSTLPGAGGIPGTGQPGGPVSDYVDWSTGVPMMGGQPINIPNKQLPSPGYKPQGFGGMAPQQQNPFADVQRLAFGAQGQSPAMFRDPTGFAPDVAAPRTNITQYNQASPFQQQAQNYMTGLYGYDPQQAQYERNTYTPGFRSSGGGFGY